MKYWSVESGEGLSDYSFETPQDAIKALRKEGFRNANFRANRHGGNRLTKRVRAIFEEYLPMQHPNGTLAFVGYHYTLQGDRLLWVNVIGKNELNCRNW